MDLSKVSKFISLILRHKPEEINISLDNHGWANVKELISGVSKIYSGFNFDQLKTIVETDNKKRYSFNSDFTKIRANQGHSINVDVELKEMIPPDILYHGTGKKSVNGIYDKGIKTMSRLYVHLSADFETAKNVGSRHGNPVVFKLDCKNGTRWTQILYLRKWSMAYWNCVAKIFH